MRDMLTIILTFSTGLTLFMFGQLGIKTYAQGFRARSKEMMTFDLIMSWLQGPISVPVILCICLCFTGIVLIIVSIIFSLALMKTLL